LLTSLSAHSFIVPILSVACNRLILSMRGLYFKREIPDGDLAEGAVDQRIFMAQSQPF
jgi:hypothetical protein